MARKKSEDSNVIQMEPDAGETTAFEPEEGETPPYTSPITEEIDNIFGDKLSPGYDGDGDDELDEDQDGQGEYEITEDHSDRLLNPNEFKLLGISSEGDRKYQVQLTADDLNISTSRTFQAESTEKHPFETVLDQIADLILPLAFSDQKRGHLSMKKLKRVFKQNKKKEPIVEYVVTAVNVGGKNGYTATSNAIQTSQLPKEFQPLFNDLENHVREEISKKHVAAEQLGIAFGESEEDE
jgi:hypothetical protein